MLRAAADEHRARPLHPSTPQGNRLDPVPAPVYPARMLAFIIILLVVWAVLAVLGFVIKGLFWLAIVGLILFVITGIVGWIRGMASRSKA